jgi:hypothetical protein
MYQPNSFSSGAKWLFWLVIVILGIVFALGFNLKDAKWLNGEIASATAEQMNVTTDIERQKSDLALQILKNQTELQIARDMQQAEYETAQQQHELNALMVADTQKAHFRSSLYNTINIGLIALMIATSMVLAIFGINLSFGLRKIVSVKAQVAKPDRSSTIAVKKYYHQPSLAAQQARQREKQERERQIQAKRTHQIFKNSKAIWSADDGKADELTPGNYPWIG